MMPVKKSIGDYLNTDVTDFLRPNANKREKAYTSLSLRSAAFCVIGLSATTGMYSVMTPYDLSFLNHAPAHTRFTEVQNRLAAYTLETVASNPEQLKNVQALVSESQSLKNSKAFVFETQNMELSKRLGRESGDRMLSVFVPAMILMLGFSAYGLGNLQRD